MAAKNNGFTIVELITVIAVLAILISITVFMIGNWRQETAENEVKSDLTNLASAMENARNFGNGYPSSLPSSFRESENVDVSLESSSLTAYCAEGTSTVETTVVYHISGNSATPVDGGC